MPSPSGAALSTQRPDLGGSFEEFQLEMARGGYIATRVLPVFEAAKQSGTFGHIPLDQLLQKRDTNRAPGGGYNRGQFTFKKKSYATDEHGVEEPVDDREANMYAEYFDAELVATQRAYQAVLGNAEQRVSDAVFNTTTWTGAALTTAVGTKWDVHATATPITDVKSAKQLVWDGSGLWANALILSKIAFNDVRLCDQVFNAVESAGAGQSRLQGRINEQLLAIAFDVDLVIVAGGAKNTANEGATVTVASVWDKTMAMVAKVAVTDDIREPCIGRTIHWAEDGSEIGGTVESYRDETVRSDIERVRHDVDELILYKEAGHLLTGVL